MRSYSQDLRGRFLRAIAHGASARAAGRRFAFADHRDPLGQGLARAWAARPQAARTPAWTGRQTGRACNLPARPARGERRDIALQEVAGRLARERGIAAALSTIWRFYAQRGITFKDVKTCARRRAAACAGRRTTSGLV